MPNGQRQKPHQARPSHPAIPRPLRWLCFLAILFLGSTSWHCGKPSAICSERDDAECVNNQDCPSGKVCWQCECIECPSGRLPCGIGGVCVDTQENTQHCGGCGIVCPQGKPLCKAGKCEATPVLDKEKRVEPGSFTMGSPKGEIGRYDDEVQHKVTLTRPFYIWTTEITQGEYLKYTNENPSEFKSCGASCPVEQVTWNEALQFCNALSKAQALPECFDCKLVKTSDSGTNSTRTDLICSLKEEYKDKDGNPAPGLCWGYRLPTEAEWEFAARAGTTSATYNGELIDPTCGPDRLLLPIAWYCHNATSTQPSGTKEPNALGLHDMLGNVREWVWDLYGDYPTKAQTDPVGPTKGSGRIVRGGCWSCRALENRAAYRFDHSSLRRESDLGFRVVRRAPLQDAQ